MDINFVKKSENFIRAFFVGESIIEIYMGAGSTRKIFEYEPHSNTLYEIGKNVFKHDIIFIKNCIFDDPVFYFAGFEELPSKELLFSVYRYDPADKSEVKILDFTEDAATLGYGNRIKIYVLNASFILVQKEIFTIEDADTLSGNVAFDIGLYNIDSRENFPVEIPDFKNNGINIVIPVSENKIFIKTGYSHYEDKRLSKEKIRKLYRENIYLTSTTQFIGDISLDATSGNMVVVESSEIDSFISEPQIKDKFIYYYLMDADRTIRKYVFYDFEKNEKFSRKIKPYDATGRPVGFVICDMPYVMETGDDETESFFNLKEDIVDMEFEDEVFITSLGKTLIFTKRRHRKNILRFYSYPALRLIHEETAQYAAGCFKNEEYYIYFQ